MGLRRFISWYIKESILQRALAETVVDGALLEPEARQLNRVRERQAFCSECDREATLSAAVNRKKGTT